MLITNGTDLDLRPLTIRVRGGTIAEVGDHLLPVAGEDVVDAGGGTIIPGLHDHHIHLRASAAALTSLQLGPPAVNDTDELRRRLASAQPDSTGWIRAIGYHESIAGDLDRQSIDRYRADVPVRVQHRSGALWTVNSAGTRALGGVDAGDGRFYRDDARFREISAGSDLRAISEKLSSMGVTGCTDATPDMSKADLDYFAEEVRSGRFVQALNLLAANDGHHDRPFTFGPVKKILDDVDLDVDGLTAWITATHENGQAVAVHCVTRLQLVVALVALRTAGGQQGDRIEHAASVPAEIMADLAASGVTVVTQPNFVGERGDRYRVDVPLPEHQDLWRTATLMNASVPVAGSTDSPFGSSDPWASMRSARDRLTADGHVLGPEERVPARTALRMFLGHASDPSSPRNIVSGSRAHLCILDGPPTTVLEELSADLVRTTVTDGEVVFTSPS